MNAGGRHGIERRSIRRPGERGAILPLTALLLVVIMLGVAFAVDLGRLNAARRDAQADADVIALDLIRLVDGRTVDQLFAASDYATSLARSTAANDIDAARVTVQWGTFDLVTQSFTPLAGSSVPDAVRVTATNRSEHTFARVIDLDGTSTSRHAVAALESVATLNLGSKLVALDSGDSQTLDFLLTQLLGSSVSLSAVTYQALADTDIQLSDVAAEAGLATSEELLSATTTAQDFGLLMAQVLTNDGKPSQAVVLESLALLANASTTVTVDELLAVTAGGPPSTADLQMNAFDQFTASLQLVNEKTAINACTAAPGLDALVAGASMDICTTIVEAPAQVTGRVGDSQTQPPTFRTAQIRSEVTGSVDVGINLGLLALSGTLELPVTLEGGGAEGTLTAIDCAALTTDTLIAPRLLAGRVGDDDDPVLTLSGSLIGLGLVNIEVIISTDASPTQDSAATIPDQTEGSVEEGPDAGTALGLGPLTTDDLNLTLTSGLLPVGFDLADVSTLLLPTVNLLLAGMETASTPLLDELGMSLSSSDLHMLDVNCSSPMLVE